MKDGSMVQINKYHKDYDPKQKIVINKYDSLMRICPDYLSSPITGDSVKATFIIRKLKVTHKIHTITVEDLEVTDTTTRFLQTICSGVAPEATYMKISDQQPTKISIYPNPVNDMLHIRNLDLHQNYQLSISTSMGNVLRQATANKVNVYDWQLGGLKAGMYYLSIRYGDKNVRLLFMKE